MTTDQSDAAAAELGRRAADLLMHHSHIPIAGARPFVVQHSDGGWGIAIVIDGWYTSQASARDMADYWDTASHRPFVAALNRYRDAEYRAATQP